MTEDLFYLKERGVDYAPAWLLFRDDKLVATFYDSHFASLVTALLNAKVVVPYDELFDPLSNQCIK